MTKTSHRLTGTRIWIVPVLLVALLAGHSLILYYVSSHAALSTVVLSSAIILLMIKHIGLLGSVYALFRRRSRNAQRE